MAQNIPGNQIVADALTNNGVYGPKLLTADVPTLAAKNSDNYPGRKSLTVVNLDPVYTVYWGYDDQVTVATGSPIPANVEKVWNANDRINVYLVSDGNVEVRITEGL